MSIPYDTETVKKRRRKPKPKSMLTGPSLCEQQTDQMPDYIEVHCTTGSRDEADAICAVAVESKLAACAQTLSQIRSTYWWRGKVERADEYLITMKTTRDKLDELARVIRDHHSYQVPEIVAVPIVDGTEDYLAWISAETREPGASA